jgi:NAD(P)-dependent dehydrogenase (short-subunit alcohol dehydrogenase family)
MVVRKRRAESRSGKHGHEHDSKPVKTRSAKLGLRTFLQKGGIVKLTGKRALITGGNSGIGLATARLFIAEGAQVAITGRDQKTLDEAIAELGSSARAYRVDVTIAGDRKQLFAALVKDFGKLDIVFANAGISGRTPTGSTDEAIFENVIHTNLNAAFFTVNSAVPLLNDNGSIIFSGSVHNYLGQPGVAAYAATKGGLVSMARSIAADLAPRNIRVNVVAPGAIKTPIWKRGPRASASKRIPLSWRSSLLLQFRRAVGASRKKLPKPCSSSRRTIPRTSTQSS